LSIHFSSHEDEESHIVFKVTICELNDHPKQFEKDWEKLVEHVQNKQSDLVLLPEMTFFPCSLGTGCGNASYMGNAFP
jgi:predicted amidohydrolase